MPFGISSITDIRRRPSVQAMSGGGYQMAETPDPNDAMETYQRGEASDQSDLGQNQAMAALAQQRSSEEREAALARNPLSMQGIRTVASDPRWDAFFGSMHVRGADKLRTGGAAGPGFSRTPGSGNYNPATGQTTFARQRGAFDTVAAPTGPTIAQADQQLAQVRDMNRLAEDEERFQTEYNRLQTAPLRRTTRNGESGYTI